jgi:hypothetical protein
MYDHRLHFHFAKHHIPTRDFHERHQLYNIFEQTYGYINHRLSFKFSHFYIDGKNPEKMGLDRTLCLSTDHFFYPFCRSSFIRHIFYDLPHLGEHYVFKNTLPSRR